MVLRRLRRARQGPRRTAAAATVRRHRRRAALGIALDALSRLLAPMLPFAAEEAWSWSHDGSIHATTWPVASGVTDPGLDLDAVSEVLQRVRRAKTEAKRSQRAEVAGVDVGAPAGGRGRDRRGPRRPRRRPDHRRR